MLGKYCPKCSKILPFLAYYMSKNKLYGYCKKCTIEYSKQYYKAWSRAAHYKTTQEHLDNMLEAQKDKCLICKKEGNLVVDHDHKSGKIRGMLCRNCNLGLGSFKDNWMILDKAAQYMIRHNPYVTSTS